jgi:hypothetical protein
MKNTRLSLLAFLIVLAFIFSSCKKDSSPTVTTNMSASIDGATWSAATTTAINGTTSSISGISASGTIISISIYDNLKVGTFTLSKYSFGVATYFENDMGYTTNATSEAGGEVIITEVNSTDHTLTGTFSFDVVGLTNGEKKSITNGVFSEVSINNY